MTLTVPLGETTGYIERIALSVTWGCRNQHSSYSLGCFAEMRYHYTFSFPNNRSSNFTCIPSTSCPSMSPAPQCPPGYISVRVGSTCGLYCRYVLVDNTYRCPCMDWMSCAVKERYLGGCSIGHYSSFRIRECKQGLYKKLGYCM